VGCRAAHGLRRRSGRRDTVGVIAHNDEIEIHFQVHGEGPPVVLMHGFPDSGRVWHRQVPALVDAGFQVIVPDMRGYGDSSKPPEIDAYGAFALAGDVLAVLDELGLARADIVGHDWGASVAWVLGSFFPQRVDRLVALSVGHPGTFFGDSYDQLEKSWYMLLFQFPGVAERWLTENDWANFRQWAGHPEVESTIEALESDGSLTPALNWYRANMSPETFVGPGFDFPQVTAPTLGVWGAGDRALTEGQMTRSSALVDAPWTYRQIADAGHWLQLDQPDTVNTLLLDFLRR
jgi:pimeloyl-ACP methyl ester carboxylesterase